jgi:hypothetical protein
MMHYIRDSYFGTAIGLVKKIENRLTDDNIHLIIETASEGILSEKKVRLIFQFLQAKASMLKTVFDGKEN